MRSDFEADRRLIRSDMNPRGPGNLFDSVAAQECPRPQTTYTDGLRHCSQRTRWPVTTTPRPAPVGQTIGFCRLPSSADHIHRRSAPLQAADPNDWGWASGADDRVLSSALVRRSHRPMVCATVTAGSGTGALR